MNKMIISRSVGQLALAMGAAGLILLALIFNPWGIATWLPGPIGKIIDYHVFSAMRVALATCITAIFITILWLSESRSYYHRREVFYWVCAVWCLIFAGVSIKEVKHYDVNHQLVYHGHEPLRGFWIGLGLSVILTAIACRITKAVNRESSEVQIEGAHMDSTEIRSP